MRLLSMSSFVKMASIFLTHVICKIKFIYMHFRIDVTFYDESQNADDFALCRLPQAPNDPSSKFACNPEQAEDFYEFILRKPASDKRFPPNYPLINNKEWPNRSHNKITTLYPFHPIRTGRCKNFIGIYNL